MACLAMNNTPGAILAALLAFDTTSRHSNLAMIDWIADFLAARGVASAAFMTRRAVRPISTPAWGRPAAAG